MCPILLKSHLREWPSEVSSVEFIIYLDIEQKRCLRAGVAPCGGKRNNGTFVSAVESTLHKERQKQNWVTTGIEVANSVEEWLGM